MKDEYILAAIENLDNQPVPMDSRLLWEMDDDGSAMGKVNGSEWERLPHTFTDDKGNTTTLSFGDTPSNADGLIGPEL